MSDTIETLSYDFPLFSKDLISEVVRLKGDRAREALTRLACDDVDSHRPSQMSSQGYDVLSCDTSAPSASENYPLSATNSSMSISTTTSADEAEVLREIDGPAPKHMIATKAESTQSGRPDVVLGEEELETVSCPGFYEEERRGFDITEKGISRDRPYSPCLEELFQLPLDTESAGSDHACERKEEKPDKIPNEEKECDQALSRAVDDSHSIERTEGDSSVERHGKKTADLVNDVPETDNDSHSRSDARRTASDQVIEQLDAQQQTGKSDSDGCEREIEDREEKADDSSNRSTIHPESEANEALPIHQTASQIIDEGETGHPDEEDSTVASSPEHLAESHTQESVDQITSSPSREQKNDAESNGDIPNQDDAGQAESMDESSDSDWSCLDIIPISAIRGGSPELVHESEEGQGVSRLLENALCPPGFEDITAESSTSQRQPSLSDLPTQTTEGSENRRTVEQSSLAGGALSQTEHNSSPNGRQTTPPRERCRI